MKRPFLALFALVAALGLAFPSQARTLRVFVVGNSFSNNALLYLPRITESAGDHVVVRSASIGGAPLEKHWNGVAAYLADPGDKKGKVYEGKSLRDLMGDTRWDVVTIQQYSLFSPNPETYRPYAERLCAFIKGQQPQARVVVHQTWAYRVDSRDWGFVGPGERAKSQAEMWERSRAAYRRIADELGLDLIPVGDAFHAVDTDPVWGYRPDAGFDTKGARKPALPDQSHSLHVGYVWKRGKLDFDSHHASPAGCYLAGLVWYATLFDVSPEKVTFAPPEISPDYAAHLREVAARVVRDQKSGRPRPPAAVTPPRRPAIPATTGGRDRRTNAS